MQIKEQFDEYYKKWCEKNKKPIQNSEVINKWWKLAWTDFTKEVLVPNWEKIKADYWDMKLLREKDKKSLKPEEDSKKTSWEKVAELIEKDGKIN